MKWEQIDLGLYKLRRETGWSLDQMMKQALSEGVGEINAIRLVRLNYGIGLVQAKEVLVRAQTGAPTLKQHQESLLPVLESFMESCPKT